jgi:pseudouridine kinase
MDSEAAIARACLDLQADGAQDVIVTRGAQGVMFTTPDGLRSLAAPAVDVVDVTGAGDAFAAAVCWSLYSGATSLDLACHRGLALSAMTIGCAQTVCPQLAPGLLDQPADSQLPMTD